VRTVNEEPGKNPDAFIIDHLVDQVINIREKGGASQKSIAITLDSPQRRF
jgi:hypothetical protein